MKIAIIGIRGIPVIYSGFESFAENLAIDLVKGNFQVTVYCRSCYVDKRIQTYKGVKLVTVSAIKNKNFESFIHSFLSTLHACIFLRPQIIYYLGVGNALFTIIPRIIGIKTIINVDGLDWRREKWNTLAKIYLFISQYLATIFPNVMITDSLFMEKYYLKNYSKKTIYIPYGFNKDLLKKNENEKEILSRYGLTKSKYFVWVGRLVPENHLEELILAFKKIKTDYKCVVIGDDFYKSTYKKFVRDLTKDDKRIIFTGFLPRDGYAVLLRNAFCYVETKRSGGTHPSLIEAMGMGCMIISNDYEANKQILKNGAVFYKINKRVDNLQKTLKLVLREVFRQNIIEYKKILKKNLTESFGWEHIILQYTQLLRSI